MKQHNAPRRVHTELEAAQKLGSSDIELRVFKHAMDGVFDFVTITDPDGTVRYANPACTRVTGFQPEEIIGKKAGQLWQLPMPAAYYTNLWKVIKTQQKVFDADIRNKRKDGREYDAHLTISPIFTKQNKLAFFVGIERDTTREKEAERTKSEFISLAAHQLRTPPGIISWDIEELLRDKTLPLKPGQRQLLREVYGTTQQMIRLINALITASRTERGTFPVQPEPLHVAQLLRDELRQLQPHISRKKLHIQQHYAQPLPDIIADKTVLQIILQNLLTNAVKYTPAGGTIGLQVQVTRRSCTIVVCDTGCGIPAGQQSQVFHKLFRADNARAIDADGNGLGLYIIKMLLGQIGGRISFTSREGKGTSFRVVLPVKMVAREGKDAARSKP